MGDRRPHGPGSGTGDGCNLPIRCALAWLLARRSWPGKSIVKTLVALPLVMPPVTKKFDDAMTTTMPPPGPRSIRRTRLR